MGSSVPEVLRLPFVFTILGKHLLKLASGLLTTGGVANSHLTSDLHAIKGCSSSSAKTTIDSPSKLILPMPSKDINDQDLDPSTINWEDSHKTPHRIYGTGRWVYWRDCRQVTLAREVGGVFEQVREIDKKTGRAVLPVGLILKCMGDGGKMKEE